MIKNFFLSILLIVSGCALLQNAADYIKSGDEWYAIATEKYTSGDKLDAYEDYKQAIRAYTLALEIDPERMKRLYLAGNSPFYFER